MISAAMVKELREKTGAGMMDCKKVLTETDGDMEKASELLRERGIAKAAKKSGRVAAEGLVDSYVSDDRKVGSIVEINAETDFVAKNEEFKAFVKDIAKIVALQNPADLDSLLNAKYLDSEKTVSEVLTDKIATIGENMSIRRFARFETEGLVESYIHGEGKIAVLVDFSKGNETTARDICMQIAAARPEYVCEKEVPEDVVNTAKFYGIPIYIVRIGDDLWYEEENALRQIAEGSGGVWTSCSHQDDGADGGGQAGRERGEELRAVGYRSGVCQIHALRSLPCDRHDGG